MKLFQRRKQKAQYSVVTLISGIAIGMLTPIALCTVGGYYLGRLIHAEAPVFIVCMFLGVAVGYRNVWVMVRRYVKDDKPVPEENVTVSEAEEEFRRWKQEREAKEDRSTS